jgi:hypothetical protein
MFTKEHYEKIAKTFNKSYAELFKDCEDADLEVPVLINVMINFSQMLAQDNSGFDKERFVKAITKGLPKDDIEFWFPYYLEKFIKGGK